MLPDPVEATDLNIYEPAELPWSLVRKHFEAGIGLPETPAFLGTVGPDGRPHSTGIGPVETQGSIYFTSGPGTRKSRNLAANPACTLSFRFPESDLIFEGTATRVVDHAELDRVAAVFAAGGWPATRDGEAVTAPYSAQSAGPAPWYLYRFAPDTAVALGLTDPHGATRWRFR